LSCYPDGQPAGVYAAWQLLDWWHSVSIPTAPVASLHPFRLLDPKDLRAEDLRRHDPEWKPRLESRAHTSASLRGKSSASGCFSAQRSRREAERFMSAVLPFFERLTRAGAIIRLATDGVNKACASSQGTASSIWAAAQVQDAPAIRASQQR
jgi:hypothetical protein